MSLPVWVYWEGERPQWIAHCHETIKAHAPDAKFLAPNEMNAVRSKDRDIDLSGLCTAHRADFLRAFLLQEFGGLWIDSDCVVLRDLQPLLDRLEEYEFLGYAERQGHVANNFMAARPGSRIASQYYNRVCQILRSDAPIHWLTCGSEALTATLKESGTPWLRLGYEMVQPVCWSNPGFFFETGDDAQHAAAFNERSFCYMLSNNMVRGFQAENPGRSLLDDGTFFRYLCRRSLAPSDPVDARRSAVGTSNWQQIPFCIEAMMDICPMRVLDVGIGFGRWGALVREFCEEWKGRMFRENWQVWLEGIEAHPANVEEYHHLFYNWIHIGDAADIVFRPQDRWNLVILGDVVEHWPREVAEQVLGRVLEMSDYALVNIPLGPGWERGPMYGNPWEEHRSSWELEDFLQLKPVRYAVFYEYNARQYGAFLLSKDNPLNLPLKEPS